ncbi:Scr1 family TA system antitoxin-like transcriptional regulator [Streptomyces eurythermus]|uniref:Scr1 family TA system antitoxin-like transcriptional regulator n=1 Tax=Streptomyces eurythermus TaxID=42237 RepID=UPI0036FC5682
MNTRRRRRVRTSGSTTQHALSTAAVSGILQTADYARHVFERHATLQRSPRDTEAAVRARMKRQEWLYRPGKRLNVLMPESVLWGRICPPDVLAAQLGRLLGVVGMDTINLSDVLDERLVVVEDWHAELTLRPDYIAQLIEVRRRRQERIAEGGVKYSAVIWEAVIEHPLSTIETHREQLLALLEAGERENVTVRVLPFSAGSLVAAANAFAAFSFDSESAVEAVTMDDLMSTSIVESPTDLAVYAGSFDLLCSSALTPEESAKLILSKLQVIEEGMSWPRS